MKKFLLFSFFVLFTLIIQAQNRVGISKNLKNVSLKKPIKITDDILPLQNENIYVSSGLKSIFETEIGSTQYDLPSNSSVDTRIYLYPDGTIGTTFTLGNTPASFPDRGTGYNYFDGTNWGTPPLTRIESIRTGWPSYSHLGATGEVAIAHDFTSTLHILSRAVKGTGAWTVASLPAPVGLVPSWPRVCVSGNNIHILASSNNAYQGQTYPLVYYRSQDAGATWDIQAQIPVGLSPADGYTQGYGGDVYSWAEPVGNTLAFVVGDNWTDLSLMKSTDNGTTWSKTIIFQHPYFDFNEATTLTPDTPYVCDGTHSVSLDANGNAHVAFGVMRVLNDDTTDAATSWFPLIDGIAMWNEGEATLTSLNPDTLFNLGKLIAWVQDKDNSGVLFDNLTDVLTQIPSYYISCSSQPQLTIDQTNGDMYLVYKSFVENLQTTAGQFFSHIWGRKFCSNYNGWGPFTELTDIANDGMECVFPTMSKTINNKFHLVYMMDYEPGLNIRGDSDPVGQNSMVYLSGNAGSSSDLPCYILSVNETNLSGNVNIYPNPVANNLSVSFVKTTYAEINIFNSLGALVVSNKFTVNKGDVKDFNLSNLSSGIYMVKIQTAEGTYTNKIIKE